MPRNGAEYFERASTRSASFDRVNARCETPFMVRS